MKISVEKSNAGTALKCFIPKSEITPDMQYISSDANKDIRKQKTYKRNLSRQKIALLQKTLEELFSNFSTYKKLNEINQKNNHIFDMVKNKVLQSLEFSMDEYEKQSFNSTYEIAKSFVFETKHKDEIDTIKDKYELDYNSNMLISIIGAFRYGKTTLIKKLFGFDDDFIFPLVDKGRTSISNCFFRAMLVRNGYITRIREGEIEKIPVADYNFINKITLQKYADFFKFTILTNLYAAFEVYCNLRNETKKVTSELKLKVLEIFIESDKANFDELFGDIDDYLNNEYSNNFYANMFSLFDKIFNVMPSDIFEADDMEGIQIPSEFKDIIATDNDFFEFTINHLEAKVVTILEEIRHSTQNTTITYDSNSKIIQFTLKQDDIAQIDDYYNYFISNKAEYRGKLLRLLVFEIYTEIDLHLDSFYTEQDTHKFKNLSSIIFTDTMGAGHKSNKNEKSANSSNDILNNLPLLNESDIIILLDDASQSMKDTTLDQIKSLVNFGLKDKILLTYSWYDYFLKNDLKNDSERIKELCKILNQKLDECFNETPNISKRLYSSLTQNELGRITFLKGLVPYKYIEENKSDENKNKRRVNKSSINSSKNESALAKLLNSGDDFGEIICLKSLLDKIIYLNNMLKELNASSCTLRTNLEDDANVIYNFFDVYKNFYDEYTSSQYNEYLISTPPYKTTEALCDRLKQGLSGFSGISRSLYPYNDAISILMKNISVFSENIFKVTIERDEDGNKKDAALSEDFIIDKIKNEFSKKVSEFFYTLIIISNYSNWANFYNDWGPGVQYRRANGIYKTLESTLKVRTHNKEANLSVATYNIFKSCVDNIIDQYGNN